MKISTFTTILAVSTSALAAPAFAGDYLTGSLGYFDVIRQNQTAAQFGAEYRFEQYEYGFRPMVGAFVTTEGSVYGYGGVHWDVAIIPNELYISPNFAVGAYSKGDGKELGGTLEFRSGIEIAYQLPNQHRVGLALNHLSNASIYDQNPGVEVAMITYSIPVGKLFK